MTASVDHFWMCGVVGTHISLMGREPFQERGLVSRRKKVRRYLGNIEERYGRCERNCVTERRRRWKTRRKRRDGGGII